MAGDSEVRVSGDEIEGPHRRERRAVAVAAGAVGQAGDSDLGSSSRDVDGLRIPRLAGERRSIRPGSAGVDGSTCTPRLLEALGRPLTAHSETLTVVVHDAGG